MLESESVATLKMTYQLPGLPTVVLSTSNEAMRNALIEVMDELSVHVLCLTSPCEVLEECRTDKPGCLLLDLHLDGMNGLNLQQKLAADGCQLPFIIVSEHGDIPSAVQAMRQGALDFLTTPFGHQHLLDRVAEALQRDSHLRLVRAGQATVHTQVQSLTPREKEILKLVVLGKLTKEISRQLSISPKTVEVHRSHIMKKLHVESAAELLHRIMTYWMATIGVSPPSIDSQSIE